MPAPAKLDSEMILMEAIALLREEGLDELTVRKLAARLNVEAPSLYPHIGGKPRLLAQVTLRLFEEQLSDTGNHATWQDWLQAFGRILWDTQMEIPDCARLVLTTKFNASDYEAMTGLVSENLARLGIEPEVALEMQLSVQALILGLGGNATGPNGPYLQSIIPFQTVVEHALAALVAGFEQRVPTPPS